MSKEKITKENLYVYYNSLISISCMSEKGVNRNAKYLLRMENLEQVLLLKLCQVPLSDFTDLKESLFFIRDIEEYQSSTNKGKKNSNKFNSNSKYELNLNKEKDEYINEKRVNYKEEFILQHMISKSFIYAENIPGKNKFNLKLTSDVELAVPFKLERIHETRSDQELLTFKQSFYIKIHIRDKDQYFYINEYDNEISKKNKINNNFSHFNNINSFYNNNINSINNINNTNNINNINNFNNINNINNINNNNNISNIININNKRNIEDNDSNDSDSDNMLAQFQEKHSQIVIEKQMISKYLFVNQSWYIKNKENLFSSQILNIIFINSNLYKDSFKNSQISEKEEQFMLSAECIDNTNEEEAYDVPEENNLMKFMHHHRADSNYYNVNTGLIRKVNQRRKNNKINQQIKVKVIPYEKEFYKHVMNNCFWVIEEEIFDYKERLKRLPLTVGSQIKIKNVLLGLYLKIKKKGNGNINPTEINNLESGNIENNEDINNQENQKNNIDNDDENEYEFELVDEKSLINKSFFLSNFLIYHYNMNKKMKYMDFKGKYALRSIFKENTDNFDFNELNKYFQPLSINIDVEKKYSLLMKNEDDFIFEIRKVDIFEANHVIYIKKIIQNLDFFLKKCKYQSIDIDTSIYSILLNISFFRNYLLNIEYIFRDEKYDINLPIEQRQLILENFGILKSVSKISEYLISIIQIIKSNEKYNENTKKAIKEILEFLTFLSKDNEEIKEKIFLDLDLILELAEQLFPSDRSILLNFIFKLIDNSEVLQEYVTGGKLNLISNIKNSKGYNNYTEKESKNKLIRMDRILMYIETSHNYLYYYKKLLSLNKVRHKEMQIQNLIIKHMQKVEQEYKYKNNYKNKLIKTINKTKKIIIRLEKALIEKADDEDKASINNLKFKKRGTIKKIKNKEVKFFGNKNNSESGYFLKNIADDKIGLGKNENKIEQKIITGNNHNKNLKNEGKNNSIWRRSKIITSFLNIFKGKDEEEQSEHNLSIKFEDKPQKINHKTQMEINIRNIKTFLTFFEKFDMNSTLFIKDKVYNDLFVSFDEAKNAKSKLSYVVNGDTKSIQLMEGIRLDPESELGQLIPFNLFNKFFPKFRCQDIFSNDFQESLVENLDEDNEDENDDYYKLNKNLCTLYTIYQFCINQYYDTLNKVLKIINNYFINYESFCDMKVFGDNMEKIKDALFSRIVFIYNDFLTDLYSSAKEKPTLLKGVFDSYKFENKLPSNELERNLDKSSQKSDIDLTLEDEHQKNVENKMRKSPNDNFKDLTQEEVTLIKSLFYFCNKYDKIIYIKDKINYLRKIKNLVDISPKKPKNNNNIIKRTDLLTTVRVNNIMNDIQDSEENVNISYQSDNYKNEFKDILIELYEKRNGILKAYIDINKAKEILTSSVKKKKDTFSNIVIAFGHITDKRFNIIVKLLMEYEIDNILGKLIYLDINKNSIYFDYNILKNLKIVQSTFKEIDNLIKKIRIDYDRRGDNYLQIIRDNNNNMIRKINSNNSNYNREYFQRVNLCLSTMSLNFLNFLNINSNNLINYEDMPKFSQMLYKENENFYKKIGFDKTFENLIEIIDCFYDFNNNPMIKLKYCQEILRIFIEVQNIYKNFKENIPEYFELYNNMIMKSLHSISLYKINIIGDEEEKTFLKICYYSCESFILIIFNSKKTFGELRPFMIDILSKLLKIYSQLKNPKNRIIFQILYTYYISRVLLFISKEKYIDDFSYNTFFQIIYPMDRMYEQILSCINEISKEEAPEESSEEEEKTEEENIDNNKIEDEKEEETEKENEEEEELNNINNDFNYYHNNKYYNNFLKKQKMMKK